MGKKGPKKGNRRAAKEAIRIQSRPRKGPESLRGPLRGGSVGFLLEK